MSTVTSINEGGDRDVAKAFGNLAYSREDGVCHLKLLANSSYVITATCPGFHKCVGGRRCIQGVAPTAHSCVVAAGMFTARRALTACTASRPCLAGTASWASTSW